MQAVASIGQLFVSYDIELIKPQLNSIMGNGGLQAKFRMNGASITNYFGTSRDVVIDNMGCTFTANSVTLNNVYKG